ncbi:MAG: hypothetical protein ABSG00_02470 [Terracidiphilus sp.]|jgi:hypothetical protein
MISERVVKLATEYLDQCLAKSEPATLIAMLGYIDSQDKTIAVAEEVNEALRQRPSVYLRREDGRLEFTTAGSDRIVTPDDVRRAFMIYDEQFWAKQKKLKSRRRGRPSANGHDLSGGERKP